MLNILKLIGKILLILLLSCPAWAVIYTTAKTGTDAASCVANPPTTDCLTIQYMIANVDPEPGDYFVVRAGTYTEHVDTDADDVGSAGLPVTLMGYAGETVIIDSDDSGPQVVRADVNYFTVKDITIRNSSNYTGATVTIGLRLRGTNTTADNVTVLDGFDNYAIHLDQAIPLSNVEVKNCTTVGSPKTNGAAGSISLVGTLQTNSNISIHDNNVTGTGYAAGVGHGIRVTGGAAGVITGLAVYNNVVTSVNEGGIDVCGNVTGNVYGNTVSATGANGIHSGGCATGDAVIDIYSNTLTDCGNDHPTDLSGILLDAFSDGSNAFNNYINDAGESGVKASSDSNHDIYNNLIIASVEFGIEVRQSDAYPCIGDNIYNNTIYHDGSAACISFTTACAGNITNNICMDSGTAATGIYIHSGATVTENYNDIFGFTVNFADESGAIGAGAQSITSDPLFVNAAGGNFDLKTGSGAINTGADLGDTYTYDYRGRNQDSFGSGWEIGARIYPSRKIHRKISGQGVY